MNCQREVMTPPASWIALMHLNANDSDEAARSAPIFAATADDTLLAGRTVLVVEDETIVAIDIQYAIEDTGGTVLGPFHHLGAANAFLDQYEGQIDAAVLDVNLHGELVFPLATRLDQRGVPFIFHTANGNLPLITAEFSRHPVCEKPTRAETLIARIADLIP